MLRQRSALLLIISLMVGGVALFGVIRLAQAATPATTFSIESVDVGLGGADLRQVLINVIRWALGFLSLVAVSYMIYGGYVWLTAAGNEQRVEKAKQIILQAAIGIVIVLLAWAIVFFVARTTGDVTTNTGTGNPPGGCGLTCPPPATSTFDIVAVNTCATPPNGYENVPRSSAVSFTFNNDLRKVPAATPISTAYDVNTDPTAQAVRNRQLRIQECTTADCDNFEATPIPATMLLGSQVFTPGTTYAGGETNPISEWLVNSNTLTFYHLSSNTPADKNLFAEGRTYRVTIPIRASNGGLYDIYNDGRLISYCRDNPSSVGNNIGHCEFDAANDNIIYTFTVGSDVSGTAIKVSGATPSDAYKRDTTVSVDRNVPPGTGMAIFFNGGVDPASITSENFQLFEMNSVPDQRGLCSGTECPNGTQIPAAELVVHPQAGNGATLSFRDTSRKLKAFTWYKLIVKDMRNLCGTVMEGSPYSWVFETSDVTPGVDLVYPANEFPAACPVSRVFGRFKTSMWNTRFGDTSCQVDAQSSFETRAVLMDGGTQVSARNFRFLDQPPVGATDMNAYCKHLEFVPSDSPLSTDRQYSGFIIANQSVDADAHSIAYGDTPSIALPSWYSAPPSIKPWHFRVAQANACYQQPVVTSVTPSQDANGACVSVQGAYFEKPSETVSNGVPETGDTLSLATEIQGAAEVKSWTNTSIVNRLNAGSLVPSAPGTYYHYKVGVNYPAPIGMLESDTTTLASAFTLQSGQAATRPCLYALTPNRGVGGTTFTATGENFGSAPGSIETTNTNPAPWTYSSWDPNGQQVNGITVPAAATVMTNEVRVQTSGLRLSNPLPFTVDDIITSPIAAPRVVEDTQCNPGANVIPSPNPKRLDPAACLNTRVLVRFTLSMDQTTASAGVHMEKISPGPVATVAGTVNANGQVITFTPDADLTGSTTYRVTVENSVRATAADGGQPLAAPYSWEFTTKAPGSTCAVDAAVIQPAGPALVNDPLYPAYGLTGVATDSACHVLNSSGTTFNWEQDANTTVGVLGPTPLLSAGPLKAISHPTPQAQPGTTVVNVSVQDKHSPNFSFTYSPTGCVNSSQCTTNGLGELCGAPACIAGHCQPVITAVDRPIGATGSWTTIKGCWFGTYVPGASKVVYANNQEGIIPDPAMCGANTWTNERIIREVPAAAVSGDVTVERGDFPDTATLANGFTVDNTRNYPNLCKVDPNSGRRGDQATLSGKDFGTKGASDTVRLRNISSGTSVDVDGYPLPLPTAPSWTAQEIRMSIPLTTGLSWNEVTITRGGETSNSVIYHTQADQGQTCATKQCIPGDDATCQIAPLGPNYACSYAGADGLGCCRLRPRITLFQPSQNSTNICPNTIEQVTFDQPLDPNTVSSNTVRHMQGPSVIPTSLSVDNTASQGTIRVIPSLLSNSANQQLALNTTSGPYVTVNNASFDNPIDDTATNWNDGVTAKVTQSNNVPPGHGGSSAFVDCYTNCATQQYVAQEIAGTNVPGRTYRVQGWISAESKSTSQGGGFITRCASGTGNCGFDYPIIAPGLFKNSNGWRKWEVIVTKSTSDNSNMQINCFAYPGSRVYCDDVTVQEIQFGPTAIRGSNGVLADITGSPLQYQTAANICQLSGLSVLPAFARYTARNQASAFTAIGLSQTGDYIYPVPGVYDWTWSWTSDTPAVAAANMTVPPDTNTVAATSDATVTAVGNGQSNITATATIRTDSQGTAEGSKISGQSQVSVEFCNNPWQPGAAPNPDGFIDTGGNCDVTGNGCRAFNFSMYYCRDTNTTPLPAFDYAGVDGQLGSVEGVNTSDPTRLKSYFFKENGTSRDTIGLLIFKNDDFLSPYDWFTKRFPLDGSGASTIIAGYPAVKSGTTTYIGVTNRNDATGTLDGLMFVFDYNSNNASPETVEIASRLLTSLTFNTNLTSAQKKALINDTTRRQDLTSIKLMLEAYKSKNGAYPTLSSGSYIPGFSTSKWPSWQETLGAELGKALPTDPVNAFSAACPNAGAEASTCWAEATKTFACPGRPGNADSKVYAYRTTDTGVDLYATMEYFGTPSFIGTRPASPICATPSTCDCFNYSLHLGL